MERYNVPAWKRTLFTRPDGYRPLGRQSRRGIPRVTAYRAYYDGEVIPGVYAIEDCDGCGQSMVPVFDLRPYRGKLHARCVTCETAILLANARRKLPPPTRGAGIYRRNANKTQGLCAYCGTPWRGRGLSCGKASCDTARAADLRKKKAAHVQASLARKSYRKRFDLDPGEPGPDCRVCGGSTGMVSAYISEPSLHGGIRCDSPGTSDGWSLSRLVPGSCEHAFLAQGGMYVTNRKGEGVRRSGISEQDEQKIIELWHQVNEAGDR